MVRGLAWASAIPFPSCRIPLPGGTRLFQTTTPSRNPSLTIRHFAPKTKRIKIAKSLVAPPGHARPERIAVIGGGLAGLAVTYHLLNSTARYARKRGFDSETLRVTIFDPCAPGEGGASAVAAGLLHWFTPRTKKKAWKPLRSMDAALKLIGVAQEKVGDKSLMHSPGLLRLALTERMKSDFGVAHGRFPKEVDALEPEAVCELHPDAPEGVYGALLKEGAVVDTGRYMRGLWEACKDSGRVEWRREGAKEITSLFKNCESADEGGDSMRQAAGGEFDTVVLCAGASIKGLSEMRGAPLTPCRGQNLILERRDDNQTPMMPTICGKYVVPNYFYGSETSANEWTKTSATEHTNSALTQRLVAGATFEYREEGESEESFLQQSSKADAGRAVAELKVPLHQIRPGLLEDWRVVGAQAGMRALPPRSHDGSIPLACKVRGTRDDVSCWMLSGLGSRGLLHHAYLGRMVARAVVAGNEKLIHADARRVEVAMAEVSRGAEP